VLVDVLLFLSYYFCIGDVLATIAEVPRWPFAFLSHFFTDGYRGQRVYKREEMMDSQIFNEDVVLGVMHCKENKGGI